MLINAIELILKKVSLTQTIYLCPWFSWRWGRWYGCLEMILVTALKPWATNGISTSTCFEVWWFVIWICMDAVAVHNVNKWPLSLVSFSYQKRALMFARLLFLFAENLKKKSACGPMSFSCLFYSVFFSFFFFKNKLYIFKFFGQLRFPCSMVTWKINNNNQSILESKWIFKLWQIGLVLFLLGQREWTDFDQSYQLRHRPKPNYKLKPNRNQSKLISSISVQFGLQTKIIKLIWKLNITVIINKIII